MILVEKLCDLEDEVLAQLGVIRALKEKKQHEQTNLIDSDEEEDPRQINDGGQQTNYFLGRQTEASKNERTLRKKLEGKKGIADKNTTFLSLAMNLKKKKAKVDNVLVKQRKVEQKLLSKRFYSFELGDHFSPLQQSVDEKDGYSGKRLSIRYIPNLLLRKCLKDCKLMRIENAFADITSPDYKPPICSNFVIFGIIAAKQNELTNSTGRKKKYMKVTLTNFRQQLTLSLFNDALKRYWKLRVGDVIGILNPQIWPYKSKAFGNGFTIFLKDNAQSIIEIGRCKDFGFCKTIKRDGSRCKVPIDISKSVYCEYHAELHFKKAAAQRVELGSNVQMFSPRNSHGEKQAMFMNLHSPKSGKLANSYQLLIDHSAPKKKDQNPGFSTPEAFKAFFSEKYTNSSFYTDAERDKAREEAIRREKHLRRKLAKVTGGENLRNVKIESKEERTKRIQATRAAFSPSTMNQIGFDPTKRIYEFGKGSGDNISSKRTRNILKLLKRESSSTAKKLKPSDEYLEERKRKWNANMKELHKPKKNFRRKLSTKSINLAEGTDNSDESGNDDFISELQQIDNDAGKKFLADKKKRSEIRKSL